jgi:hypothetical protein
MKGVVEEVVMALVEVLTGGLGWEEKKTIRAKRGEFFSTKRG